MLRGFSAAFSLPKGGSQSLSVPLLAPARVGLAAFKVTARAGDKTVFLIEASQAGIFGIRGVGADQLQPVLAIHCPTVLFPYARETVADATMRAGFPPVQLAPINFDVLYQQQLAQAQPAVAGAAPN